MFSKFLCRFFLKQFLMKTFQNQFNLACIFIPTHVAALHAVKTRRVATNNKRIGYIFPISSSKRWKRAVKMRHTKGNFVAFLRPWSFILMEIWFSCWFWFSKLINTKKKFRCWFENSFPTRFQPHFLHVLQRWQQQRFWVYHSYAADNLKSKSG